MSICLVDLPVSHRRLLPLTFAKPISELRVGITTIKEKWEHYLGPLKGYRTVDYLSSKYGPPRDKVEYFVNASVLPTTELVDSIKSLKNGKGLFQNGEWIAARVDDIKSDPSELAVVEWSGDLTVIAYPWDIFMDNGQQILSDYRRMTSGRSSSVCSDPYLRTYGDQIFIEPGAQVRSATLNSQSGPIYIGRNAIVEENAVIQGPTAVCEESHVRIGGRLRPNTTVGPGCKVGGEISNSVLMANSNKAHDGYLGNSVIGEWCNLGADTNTSNLKNNYTMIKLWDYDRREEFISDLRFCGLMMGDHAKCGINTMFNSGSNVGFSSSMFGAGFPQKFIPPFTWGGVETMDTYALEKALETAEVVMVRRQQALTEVDRSIFRHIFESTADLRPWEKS